jgi:hypothetical protein
VRFLIADEIALPVDDVDPYRGCYPAPVGDRLTEEEFNRWQQVFATAWNMLRSDHPELVEAVRAGVRVVTPLSGEPGRFATARHAYGAVAMSEPADTRSLVMLMVRGLRAGQMRALRQHFDLTGRDVRVADSLHLAHDRLAMAGLLDAEASDTALHGVLDALRDLSERSLPDAGRMFVADMRAGAMERLAVHGSSARAAAVHGSG